MKTLLGLFLLGHLISAEAQTPTVFADAKYPVTIHSDSVRRELSVMALLSYHQRREQSRCVTRWTMERTNGQLAITLLALGPAEVAWSDSTNLAFYPASVPWDTTFRVRVCGDSLPDIHSHMADNGALYTPSERDWETAEHHPAAFRFLLSVIDSTRYRLTLYGLRGRP